MPTYFLPLKSGSHKKWGSFTKDFWYCHGTMVQAQTIYPQLCYYKNDDDNTLILAQFIPSECNLDLNSNKIKIAQTVNMKHYNDAAFFDDSKTDNNNRWQLKIEVISEKPFSLKI